MMMVLVPQREEGNNKLRASESFNDSFGVECRLAKSKGLPTSASHKQSVSWDSELVSIGWIPKENCLIASLESLCEAGHPCFRWT